MAGSSAADWWQVGAAFAQAILSAAAVWLAVKLQDRSAARQEKEARRERWEAAALVARLGYTAMHKATSSFTDGMDPQAVLRCFELGDFKPTTKAIDDIRAPEISDLHLLEAWLSFETAWQAARGRVEALTGLAQTRIRASSLIPINARSFIDDRGTELFNAAASVERRVAQLANRAPRL